MFKSSVNTLRAGAEALGSLALRAVKSRQLSAALFSAAIASGCGLFRDTHQEFPEDVRNGLKVQNGVNTDNLRVYANGANPYTDNRETENCYYVATEITPISEYDDGGVAVPNADQLTHVASGYELDLEHSSSGVYDKLNNPNGCPETPPVMDQVTTGMAPINDEAAEIGTFNGKVFNGIGSLNRGVTNFEEICIQSVGSDYCENNLPPTQYTETFCHDPGITPQVEGQLGTWTEAIGLDLCQIDFTKNSGWLMRENGNVVTNNAGQQFCDNYPKDVIEAEAIYTTLERITPANINPEVTCEVDGNAPATVKCEGQETLGDTEIVEYEATLFDHEERAEPRKVTIRVTNDDNVESGVSCI